VHNATLVLCAGNLLLIAALPRFFFQPGRLNAAWWATAAPFGAAGLAVLAAAAGFIRLPAIAAGGPGWLSTAAVLPAAASIGLIGYTLGTHARPVSLWHQQSDTPAALVTRGAYKRLRHPFYAAFVLALLACLAAVPHALTAAALGYGTFQLYRTAKREERRLLSAFGEEYDEYMRRTGRFFPRL
jgi:protein-S-isoprenylcysteine O-methyltransferase Ste14